MTVMGRVYAPGEVIAPGAIPPHTLSALLKLRRVQEVEDATSEKVVAEVRKRGRPKGSRNKASLVGAEA